MPEDRPLAVVAVLGVPRSGSTVLGRLVGELDGAVAVGELRAIWTSLVRTPDRLCGCGERFLACPFWSEVLDRLGITPTPDELRRLSELQGRAIRRVHPWLGTRRAVRAPAGVPAAAQGYVDLLARTYRAIADVAGARVVVDSSKKSDYLAVATGLPGLDGLVVHTLRDARAVLYSHHRRARGDASASQPREAVVRTASWVAESVSAAYVRRHRDPSLLVRYEEFAADPRRVVGRIAAATGLDIASLPLDADGTARLGPAHTVLGSPTRFDTGAVAIRLDDEWRTGLHWVDRSVARALSAPVGRYVASTPGRARA